MFKIGIGPSSSHTVGPMMAALEFRKFCIDNKAFKENKSANLRLQVELFGSLSATGRGHYTDGAVCAGLIGLHPRSAAPNTVWGAMPDLKQTGQLELGDQVVKFQPEQDLLWEGWLVDGNSLPHPNTIRFRILTEDGIEHGIEDGIEDGALKTNILCEKMTVSVGGGFIEPVDPRTGQRFLPTQQSYEKPLPYPYNSAAEFVDQCVTNDKPAWEIVIANEEAKGMPEKVLRQNLAEILQTFADCIARGLASEGILPGGLNVRRRAKSLWEQMKAGKAPGWSGNDLRPSIYAMAVNEENACGGRVVTAPTNGSSGLIPAVWKTLQEANELSEETLQNGLMVASVIGALVKTHASISGAEVGCQGEVGTSCAMAAAGAVAMLGGTPYQQEQAAEIGIEHHLGMTCDPIMGLVQVPCIERNAMGAVKALNAACLSLASDGKHLISLDRALEVMRQTGLDMNQKYKETSTGGLALG